MAACEDLQRLERQLEKVENSNDLDSFAEYYENFDEDLDEPTNPSPEKLMLWIAQNGLVDRAKEILNSSPELIMCQDTDGYTPLHRACYNNKPLMVDFLLSRGAPMSLATKDGWLPIHSACKWGNYDCLLKLLMHGSPLNDTTEGGQTPLHLAAACRTDKKCLRLLLSWPGIRFDITNNMGDTAYDIAMKSTAKHDLFHISKSCFNHI